MPAAETFDVVVGIPSFNNADTIGHVVNAVDVGLAKYFPGLKAVIVNSDGGSRDGTPDVVRSAAVDSRAMLLKHPLQLVHRISTPYHGIPGKGSAIRTVLQIAQEAGARACAVVDADLRSITPEWIELLLTPVLRDTCDFVAPLYERHKFDGTITNSIVYPLTRALYGRPIRQPIGGEFGFSGKLVDHLLEQDVWGSDIARFGIDIWMTTEAVAGGFEVCQSYLGAKIHAPKDPGSDLSDMLVQVVGSLFELTEKHAGVWKAVTASTPVRTYGFRFDVGLEHVSVNVAGMLKVFREGLRGLGDFWTQIVGAGDFRMLEALGKAPDGEFRFPLSLWTRVVYDFALACHRRSFPAPQIVRSLTPLYLGKTASFILEVRDRSQREAEEEIERLCGEFEGEKSWFAGNWA